MRVQVRYRGRVQGVGFRATAHALARERAVTGWVLNERDGSVLLEAQGEGPEVEALLSRIEEAMVRYIQSADRSTVADVAGERGFEIRY